MPPGNLVERPTPGPHSRPKDSGALGVGPPPGRPELELCGRLGTGPSLSASVPPSSVTGDVCSESSTGPGTHCHLGDDSLFLPPANQPSCPFLNTPKLPSLTPLLNPTPCPGLRRDGPPPQTPACGFLPTASNLPKRLRSSLSKRLLCTSLVSPFFRAPVPRAVSDVWMEGK